MPWNNLTEDYIALLLSEKKSILKRFFINGEYLRDRWFPNLLICDKLQEFGVNNAFNINKIGTAAISKLQNLTTLKLTRANLGKH